MLFQRALCQFVILDNKYINEFIYLNKKFYYLC